MSDNASVEAQSTDPLKTVADAMENAVRAAKEALWTPGRRLTRRSPR